MKRLVVVGRPRACEYLLRVLPAAGKALERLEQRIVGRNANARRRKHSGQASCEPRDPRAREALRDALSRALAAAYHALAHGMDVGPVERRRGQFRVREQVGLDFELSRTRHATA